ncbi:MAG TPA: DJ-1/PfpI family protein [Caulobacteraceae bacterium]|jgi:transcriptional regulator GlxA family with amidase domain|nr:DJ-1/PfpI family protein [Caulobacteraceae bacterium]
MAEPFVVVFAIFPDLTQLDFTGPYEVLSRLPRSRTVVASEAGGLVRSERGLSFETTRLAEVDRCDLVCVPGGPGVTPAMGEPMFLSELKRLADGASYVTSVCTGALLLGAAGLLRGKRATTHWAYRDILPTFGATVAEGRVVRDGNLFTGGGVTAGIDFGLTVAAEIAGEEAAQAIQLMIEYDPAPPFNAGSPETAPRAVLERFNDALADNLAARREAAERAARKLD